MRPINPGRFAMLMDLVQVYGYWDDLEESDVELVMIGREIQVKWLHSWNKDRESANDLVNSAEDSLPFYLQWVDLEDESYGEIWCFKHEDVKY